MGFQEFDVIKPRQKTGEEIPCPVCGTKIIPKCPFYPFCVYRLSDLGSPHLCVTHPEMCDFFKKQGGAAKINVKVNPSRRDEQDYEPI
jgi:hypothetical protein